MPESFFSKVANLRLATLLLKKALWCRCFPVNLAKFLKNTFFTEHFRAIILNKHLFWRTFFPVYWLNSTFGETVMVSGSIAFHAEKSICTPPKSEIWDGFCFVKTSNVLPDNIAAVLWLQSSNHILISENWYLVEESANLSPLSCQWKLDWTIVNHKSNASPSWSKFTIMLLNSLLEQNAIRPALPLTSHCTKNEVSH